jgi:peptidylprolyl isomerase
MLMMDRRIQILIGLAGLLGVLIVVVLVSRGGEDEGSSGDAVFGEKPVIEAPEEPPPAELEVEDIIEGDGAAAKEGDTLSVEYVGVLYDTGTEFDSNFGTGMPFQVQLGAGGVIPGWDEGLVGMKEGGRRQLIIPPELAYGPQGQPPDIPPDSTLIFQIDLVSVN